jgi:hypothetical protein
MWCASNARSLVSSSSLPCSKHVLNAQVRCRSLSVCLYLVSLCRQVSIRAPCCRKWFDVCAALLACLQSSKKTTKCAECHQEKEEHDLAKATEMTFVCKKCKSEPPRVPLVTRNGCSLGCPSEAFRKDMDIFEESDEYCPHVRHLLHLTYMD